MSGNQRPKRPEYEYRVSCQRDPVTERLNITLVRITSDGNYQHAENIDCSSRAPQYMEIYDASVDSGTDLDGYGATPVSFCLEPDEAKAIAQAINSVMLFDHQRGD